jgi:hypothetical protein
LGGVLFFIFWFGVLVLGCGWLVFVLYFFVFLRRGFWVGGVCYPLLSVCMGNFFGGCSFWWKCFVIICHNFLKKVAVFGLLFDIFADIIYVGKKYRRVIIYG